TRDTQDDRFGQGGARLQLSRNGLRGRGRCRRLQARVSGGISAPHLHSGAEGRGADAAPHWPAHAGRIHLRTPPPQSAVERVKRRQITYVWGEVPQLEKNGAQSALMMVLVQVERAWNELDDFSSDPGKLQRRKAAS